MTLAAVCFVPHAGLAQTVISNPSTLVFTPSTDHNVLLSDGRPAVDHYGFDVYAVGASQPFQSTNIGKPAPAADGYIYYDFSSAVPSWPLPGGNYESRVTAVGPTGTTPSGLSNEFTFDSCSYTITPTSALLPAAGGGTQIGLTTGASCTWNATSNATWVSLSTSAGTGNATIVATVAANTATTSRTATVTVGGQPFRIDEQAAPAPCSYTISPASASLPAAGGTARISVATGTSCTWTATSPATWVTLSPAGGTGNATIVATVAANTATTARTATVTAAGQPFRVDEQAATQTGTAPGAPASPSPATGSTNVVQTPTLTWTSTGATSYTIRFGTVNPPPQVATGLTTAAFAPGTLAPTTRYYWQVIAVNAAGTTQGPVWSFTTRRGKKK